MAHKRIIKDPAKLRSRRWFDNPNNPGMTALYLERYMNSGLTREELQVGKPIIGIAQSGSSTIIRKARQMLTERMMSPA